MSAATGETMETLPGAAGTGETVEDRFSDAYEKQIDVLCGMCDGSLDLETFKTQRCCGDGPHSHDSKCCLMFHHRFDRRRPLSMGYLPEPCEHEFLQEDGDGAAVIADDRVICPAGDQCSKCHNVVELLYHSKVYKRRLCMDAINNKCPRGALCAFAHSEAELQEHAVVYTKEEIENPTQDFYMYRYKTQWCPLPGVHDWDSCVYAHTKRDIRRIPNSGYSTRRCPNWERGLAAELKEGPALSYDACCPRGVGCHMAHGVKEVLYHPDVYRMRICSSAENCRGARRLCCAFAHSTNELRSPEKVTSDRKMCVEALEKEQPQFFLPLNFISFKDVRSSEGKFVGPRTPSPGYDHRKVPEAAGDCVGQALQQTLQSESARSQEYYDSQSACSQEYYDSQALLLSSRQSESVCSQEYYDSQALLPNLERPVPNPHALSNDQQHNWVDDCCIANSAYSAPASVAVPISPPTPQVAGPCQWKYLYDAAGNLHIWPDAPSQTFGPVPEYGVMDLSPKPVPPVVMNKSGRPCNSYEGDLRSESMWSWGSSTIASSTGGYSSSVPDELRSNSMGSWGSSSSSPTNACYGHEAAWSMVQTNPLGQECIHEENSQPRTGISAKFAQIRAKLKPKQKSSAPPARRYI